MVAYDQTLRQATSLCFTGQAPAGYPLRTLENTFEVWSQQEEIARAALYTTASDVTKEMSEENSARQALCANSTRHTTKAAETLANTSVNHFEFISRERAQLPSPSSTSIQYLFEETGRARTEQAERDERQRKQTESSDEQLRILAAQVEEGKRSQAAQKWSARISLLLAGAALLVSILTGFWDAEELRAMVMNFFDTPHE